ncbi:MAG TPA: COX15/CtaA family protein [Candidatus Limnocylindrales bacterium]|nr:COX15/CtaA family protein [Candidatus Limnocylindrales bacterium]
MKIFRALVVAGMVVAFALAMLGSWTRINLAGMTCPDWPLCRGAVVPVLHGGVVLEWLHRLLAFFETFIVAGIVVTGLRLRSAIRPLGGMLIALAAVFVLQVLLGGVTIKFANSPLSVMIHWGAAMLLLAVLCSLAIVAFTYDARQTPSPRQGGRGTAPLAFATACAFVTMCAGAYVSSSGAGLACLSVPGCGPGFLGETVPQTLQMTHRLLAAALVLFAAAAAVLVPAYQRRATLALRVALVLLALQIALGVLNVVWLLPTALREAHAANAVATFLAFVSATVLASLETASVTVAGRSSRRIISESV